MRVQIRGKTYESVPEAAQRLGVHKNHIYKTLLYGNPDTIGFGKGHKPPGNPNYGGARSRPITLAGHTFPSIAAASRALGWKPKRLEQVLRIKGARQMENLYAALLALAARHENAALKRVREEPVEGYIPKNG